MEKRGLFIDCPGSNIVWQIKNFFQSTYPDVFPTNLGMMGTIYPFLSGNNYYNISKKRKYDRDFETFVDQAIQLINGKNLNMVVVASEPDCLRYSQLLENGMIMNYVSQKVAFYEALKRFKIFLEMCTNISTDNLIAWYVNPYDSPEKIAFEQIMV